MRKTIFILNIVISLLIMIVTIIPSLYFNVSLFNTITTIIWLIMILIIYHYAIYKSIVEDEDDF